MSSSAWVKSSYSASDGCVEVLDWRKSSRSNTNGACVEVAHGDNEVLVRDTKDKGDGPILRFSPTGWDAFLGAIKDGKFNTV